MKEKIMEYSKNPIFLLLISSSFLPFFFTDAICVPRNITNTNISHSPSSSPYPSPPPPIQSPSPPADSPDHDQLSLSHKVKPPFLPSKPHPILQKICAATEHPQECIASVTPLLTSTAVDPLSVLKIEIRALRKGFEKAMAAAKMMMKEPSTSAWVKSCLDTCLEVYDSGIFDLDNALKAIVDRDIYRLKTLLSGTISYVETCEDSFTEEAGVDSPMKEIDEELDKLASNNLAIATLLRWSHNELVQH